MSALRQRQPRVEDKAFLAYTRTLHCVACGRGPPCDAAHIRMSDSTHNAINPGVGAKPDDSKAVPLCRDCHMNNNDSQHRIGERKFWASLGIDPFAIARLNYAEFQTGRK